MAYNEETAQAFIRLAATMIVSIGTTIGWAMDMDLVVNIIASAVSIFMAVRLLWWKNNNVTPEAQKAQVVLDELKESNNG